MDTVLDIREADAFYGKAQILFGVSVTVRRGEVVAVIGANGAGKSTTLNLVMGRLKPSGGHVELDGHSIAGAATEQIIAAGVACVPQRRRIFPTLTVLENLEVGGYVRRKEKAGLARTLDEVYGLFPMLKKKSHMLGGVLSGGEQQMLAIGRGLAGAPRLLMLDEPSMGLAPSVADMIFERISQIHREDGLTILLVEQRVAEALERSDHGYVLETGHIVLEGPYETLLADDRVRRSYLGLTEA